MANYTISVNATGFAAVESHFKGFPALLREAINSATNQTLNHGRAEITRQLAPHVNIKKQYIRDAITIIRPRRDGTNVSGILRTDRKPLPLSRFPNTQTQAGTVVYLKPGKPTVFRHFFQAKVKARQKAGFTGEDRFHAGIFSRPDNGQRYPIRQRFGPTVEGTFEYAPQLILTVTQNLGAFFLQRFNSQVSRYFQTPGPLNVTPASASA